MYVAVNCAGVFLLDSNGAIIDLKAFPEDVEERAEIFWQIQEDIISEEIVEFLEKHLKEGVNAVFEDKKLAERMSKRIKVNVLVERGAEPFLTFRSAIPWNLIDQGVVNDAETYIKQVREISLSLGKKGITKFARQKDKVVIQVIATIDDIDKTINFFAGRLRDWYNLHFPEASDLLEDHHQFFRFISEIESRLLISRGLLEEKGFGKIAEKMLMAAEGSMGAEFSEEDLEPLKNMAKTMLELAKRRQELAKYLEKIMSEITPNLTGLIGPLLGSRLIHLAGGLKELAFLPSTVIQVLGAEKALFRFLKTGTKPPKHGVIFQHAYVHNAPKWQRGKISRVLSGKIAIAARIDAFTGDIRYEELQKDMEERIKEIRKKYPSPPPKKQAKTKRKLKEKKKGKKRVKKEAGKIVH
ncbi:MAG: C/D box methylation guide ribonucleoprotein complex aNOP56 subunit [Candidatus Wukongarchaeota archaeon]|nr:C/D box methylation guide ribonucleoprotein complex aNOP56 subunit [Candidatus Wukongarchaeota archaeon]